MSIKAAIARQYRDNVNAVRVKLAQLQVPPEGWLRTMRKALGMSGAQLARRAGVSRALISKIELVEASGSVTLRTMQQMAEAMNCRFVYAIVPEHDVESVIEARARDKAEALVKQASIHMALEDQLLSKSRLELEIKRVTKELLDKPSALWDDV
jgi:predicted DNA-binding mobile mystery protein A